MEFTDTFFFFFFKSAMAFSQHDFNPYKTTEERKGPFQTH